MQADRQVAHEPARDRDRRQAGEVRADRVDVVQVHRDRIARLLADAERGLRRRRAGDKVDVAKRAREVVADEFARFLRLQVVRVEVAGRQHVRAREDSALDLGTEAFAAVAHVERREVFAGAALGAMTETHPVEAREIRRRFGRRDDVIGGHGQMNVLELDGLQFRAELRELGERGAHRGRVLRLEPVEEALGHADTDVVPLLADLERVLRHGLVERGRVALVEARHRFEQQCRVLGRLRQHAGLVEARRERDHAVAGHAPVGGLEAGDA